MKIKHRGQPYPSNLCGQACVAMLLNISIDKAVELIQKRGSTQTKDISSVLNRNGFDCDSHLTRISKNRQRPELCILKLTLDGRHSGHWVLWNGETKMYHDPTFNIPIPENMYNRWLRTRSDNLRITSFLEIRST